MWFITFVVSVRGGHWWLTPGARPRSYSVVWGLPWNLLWFHLPRPMTTRTLVTHLQCALDSAVLVMLVGWTASGFFIVASRSKVKQNRFNDPERKLYFIFIMLFNFGRGGVRSTSQVNIHIPYMSACLLAKSYGSPTKRSAKTSLNDLGSATAQWNKLKEDLSWTCSCHTHRKVVKLLLGNLHVLWIREINKVMYMEHFR